MRVLLALFVGTMLVAGRASAQNLEPCPATQTIPLSFSIAEPVCPDQPLRLLVGACGPCISQLGWVHEPSGPITVLATMDVRQCILTVCMPETLSIPLGAFAAGHHELAVQVRATVIRADSTRCSAIQTRTVAFDVPVSCPPPRLPYTSVIRVGPPPPCATCPPPPICPGRPIPFFMAGTLPDDCYQFRGLQLLPSPIASPLPAPPIVRAIVAVNDCLGRPCIAAPVPWQGHATLPPLPGGSYGLIVQVAEVSWCDTTQTPDTLFTTLVPFTVAPACSLPPAPECFVHAWRDDAPSPACSATIGADGLAHATFSMATGTVLGGVQGRFTLDPPALSIRNLRPVGIAEGMQLLWSARPDGAEFVLFSTDGRPLRSPCIPPAACPPVPDPMIEVTLGPRPGVPLPARTALDVRDLLAADTLGREVQECPTFAPIPPAWICAGRLCDANGDGRLDVRDLVLLARCVTGLSACPDSALARLDCDADGGLDVDDVLCCARRILRGRLPDSLATRPAPGLHASVGAPTAVAGGTEIRVRLSGADLVGAARFGFAYPAAAYVGASVSVLGDAAQWLAIPDMADGELVLGLVALAPAEVLPGTLDLVLRLDAAAGSSGTGAVSLERSEFVAADGAVLVPSSSVSTPPGASRFELSPARPNPFRRDTRVELSLSAAADVDLGVFDLVGRRVATLHRGPLPAGDHGFRWSGRDDQGARVHDGVYFCRVRNGAVALTRRLVLIGDR